MIPAKLIFVQLAFLMSVLLVCASAAWRTSNTHPSNDAHVAKPWTCSFFGCGNRWKCFQIMLKGFSIKAGSCVEWARRFSACFWHHNFYLFFLVQFSNPSVRSARACAVNLQRPRRFIYVDLRFVILPILRRLTSTGKKKGFWEEAVKEMKQSKCVFAVTFYSVFPLSCNVSPHVEPV